jgi:hypothetical protein
MKNLAIMSFALFLLIVLFEACEKKDLSPFSGQIVASLRDVGKNFPDTLLIIGAENEQVEWNVTPDTYNIIKKEGNKLIVSFTNWGVYTISATVNGGKPLTQTVSCSNISEYYTKINIDNETLALVPRLFKLPTTDSTFFDFKIQSNVTSACVNSGFKTSQTQNNNHYIFYIESLLQPTQDCIIGGGKVGGNSQPFYPQVNSPIVLGTSYPLTINVGSKVYTGSVVFGKTTMDITWEHTKGIIMSSKHVTL